MTTGFSGKRSSTGGSSPESTFGCNSGGSLRPCGTTGAEVAGAAVAGASVATAPGVAVGATPQAVATVPTSATVDTFKKSRRLIFLLSISVSFCLSLLYETDLYLAPVARYILLNTTLSSQVL